MTGKQNKPDLFREGGDNPDWRAVATISPRSEMAPLIRANHAGSRKGLDRNEAHHCRSAQTDVANSGSMSHFFEGS